MELLDLYNEERVPLGKTMKRGDLQKNGEYYLIVAIWTVDQNGNLLLTKRSPEKEFFPNEWENSGGAVLSGETSAEAAIRELYEETGIHVLPNELILLGSCREDEFFVDTYFVLKNEPKPKVTLQPGETSDYRWVTLEMFDRMAAASQIIKPAVRQITPLRKKLEQCIIGASHVR